MICASIYGQTDTLIHLHAFGGLDNDNAEEVRPTHDGGYIVIGSTSSNSAGNTDAYLLKVDSLCNYQWSTALGGSNNDWGYSVKQTFDKGYIVALSTNSFGHGGYDACLMKRDSMGNYEWKRNYGGADWDFAYSVVQTYDSGFVFCGETYNNSAGFSDVFIVKTNPIGDTLWTKIIGGNLKDKGTSIIETADSNIVVGGIRTSASDSSDMYVIRLTANGSVLWDSVYVHSKYESLSQIIENTNGEFTMVGSTTSSSVGSDQDYLIKRIDANGNWLWDFIIVNGPVPTPQDEEALSVVELPSSRLLITGYSETGANSKNLAFFQLHASGNWAGVSNVVSGIDNDYIKNMTIGANGNIVGAGATESFGNGNEDLLLVRLDTIYNGQDTAMYMMTDATPLTIKSVLDKSMLKVYPNPTRDYLNLFIEKNHSVNSIVLYDLVGKQMLRTVNSDKTIDLTTFPNGTYLLEVSFSDSPAVRTKIIKD